nr:hypothetical protein WI23_30335 [Burkholderia oklahomensis C6786]
MRRRARARRSATSECTQFGRAPQGAADAIAHPMRRTHIRCKIGVESPVGSARSRRCAGNSAAAR